MATSEGGQPPNAGPAVDQPPATPQTEADYVITVVAGTDAGGEGNGADDGGLFESLPPMDLGDVRGSVADVPPELLWLVGEINTTRTAAQRQAEHLAAVEGRLAPLEAVPAGLDGLSRATRLELERCAGVLFGHDRALNEARERLEAMAARVGELDALRTGDQAYRPAAAGAVAPETSQVYDKALARILDQLDGLTQRLVAMEARVEPLEPIPTVVQALRRAVRASDDLLTGEVSAREAQVGALAGEIEAQAQARDDAMRRLLAQDLDRMAGLATGNAETLESLAARLSGAEARLAPLDSAPSDIEALSRILRRELDALTTDAQARDQMLRRALQNEIDQLHAASAAREAAAAELATRLDTVEGRLGETHEAHTAAVAAATDRLGALEGRAAANETLGTELEALREVVRTELEQLRADAKAHDQVMGEITRKFAALDARMARVDPLPGELLSLRTALRQEAERSVTQVRAVEERLTQLDWVPAEFQEARKRILTLTSGLQVGQDSIRSLEAALASTNERVKALAGRLGMVQAPGPPA